MTRAATRLLLACFGALTFVLAGSGPAWACEFITCGSTTAGEGAIAVEYAGTAVAGVVGASESDAVDYVWRLRRLCELSDERAGACSPMDFRDCPQEPGRVIEYLVVEQRPVVRPDGTAVIPVPAGFQPGDLLDNWTDVRQGCIDITDLDPPPTPAEVFSYFQRLPLPQLTTRHQPPDAGLTGLPVIFYTDSPAIQTFTVDIRGFTVAITAEAQRYTWHTGDPATPTLTSTEPGRPYPAQTIQHRYRSGTYTASLTVTWEATFTVDGGAPADVPGTTTTQGPPVSFDVLQARAVLTNPYD